MKELAQLVCGKYSSDVFLPEIVIGWNGKEWIVALTRYPEGILRRYANETDPDLDTAIKKLSTRIKGIT